MIRGLLGAFIGSRVAGRGGVRGAAMGYGAQRVITRMGTPGLMIAGGYGLWRYMSSRRRQRNDRV